MKAIAIILTICGGFISTASWFLAQAKARIIEPAPVDSEWFADFVPPSALFEFILLAFGIATFFCAFYQRKGHIKYNGIQMILSLTVIVVSLFLSIRAATIGHLEISAIYFSAYILLVIGIIIFIIGLVQIINMVEKN